MHVNSLSSASPGTQFFESPGDFRAGKPFFVNMYLKTDNVYAWNSLYKENLYWY